MCHSVDPSSTHEPPREQGSLQDLSGKFVIVTYDELLYVGLVLEVVGKEVQVSSMWQSGEKDVFMWPQTPDIIFYYEKNVHAVISEPGQATSRSSKLSRQGWAKFRNAWGQAPHAPLSHGHSQYP